MTNKAPIVITWIAKLAGMFDAAYLSCAKSNQVTNDCKPDLSNFGAVRSSVYSNLFGIPVSYLGRCSLPDDPLFAPFCKKDQDPANEWSLRTIWHQLLWFFIVFVPDIFGNLGEQNSLTVMQYFSSFDDGDLCPHLDGIVQPSGNYPILRRICNASN